MVYLIQLNWIRDLDDYMNYMNKLEKNIPIYNLPRYSFIGGNNIKKQT